MSAMRYSAMSSTLRLDIMRLPEEEKIILVELTVSWGKTVRKLQRGKRQMPATCPRLLG